MNENEPASDRVVLSDQPVADFSHLTAPEQLAVIGRIEHVALVIVPESLAAAYAAIPSSGVASTVYVPDGANVRVHTGALLRGGHREESLQPQFDIRFAYRVLLFLLREIRRREVSQRAVQVTRRRNEQRLRRDLARRTGGGRRGHRSGGS